MNNTVNLYPIGCTSEAFRYNYFNATYQNITEEPRPEDTSKSNWEIGIKATMYALIWIVAFLGNSVVIIIIIMNKSMRTTTNIFVTHLAISDLTIVLCPMWVKAIDNLTFNWILGEQLCKLWQFVTGK